MKKKEKVALRVGPGISSAARRTLKLSWHLYTGTPVQRAVALRATARHSGAARQCSAVIYCSVMYCTGAGARAVHYRTFYCAAKPPDKSS